ncbi:MAG TPA: protein kinase [Pyrinomonadaceae bacterium]|nr:protein kinase [Pyrinomonadaceae bacterium]
MPKPNDKIGPYTLIQKLGRGTFGVVWLAEKRSILATTKVALKLPNDDDIDLEVVRQEADLWVRVSGHPNVLPIIDADIYDEQIVIVSEYAPDGSLSKWLARHGGKAPSTQAAVDMTLGILSGLEHLHEKGIIHRDIKPDNILLQKETPRLADFGIARILRSTSKSTASAGTPAYMPPEAFDGRRSERTDIWSVGVILYRLLAGRLPFPQPDNFSLMFAILNRQPEQLPNDVPEPLRAVIERALQKVPDERYSSANEMFRALRSANHSVTWPAFDSMKPPTLTDIRAPSAVNPDPETKPSVLIEIAALTDAGHVLTANEDNYLVLDLSNGRAWTASDAADLPDELRRFIVGDKGVILAVADGNSRALAGEVASRMAVETIREMLVGVDDEEDAGGPDDKPLIDYLRHATVYANLAVHHRSMEDARCAGMSTTLTAAAITGGLLDVVQVGDSRAYLIRNQRITLITKDQTRAQQLVDVGFIIEAEAETHESSNELVQAIGQRSELTPVTGRLKPARGDILLICSDGLWRRLRPIEIQNIVNRQGEEVAAISTELVRAALDKGAGNNITALVAKFDGTGLLPSHQRVGLELQPAEDDDTLPGPDRI